MVKQYSRTTLQCLVLRPYSGPLDGSRYRVQKYSSTVVQ